MRVKINYRERETVCANYECKKTKSEKDLDSKNKVALSLNSP